MTTHADLRKEWLELAESQNVPKKVEVFVSKLLGSLRDSEKESSHYWMLYVRTKTKLSDMRFRK